MKFTSYLIVSSKQWPIGEYTVMLRVPPRFFVQDGHETMYASSENKHFFH